MPHSTVCTDMLGRTVAIQTPVQRIVSLVPSQTEFLYALGLGRQIAGRTVFCKHPHDQVKQAIQVGGTKKIKFETIDEIKPDLIVCNKEENTNEIVEILEKKYPVWVSDIRNVDDAYLMMESLGTLLGKQTEAESICQTIRHSFNSSKIRHRHSCLYLIWRKPFMAAGCDTFISSMMELGGFKNVLELKRYPELSEVELMNLHPEVVFLSSEPYPFTEKHISEIQSILPQTKIMTVDGEMFSWYGNRLSQSQEYFNELQRKLHKAKR